MTVAEETIPAEADSGLRRFSVTQADGSRISIQVMQEKEADECEGEIHATGIRLSREVCTNEQITRALIQIAATTVRFLGQSLPDDAVRWEVRS